MTRSAPFSARSSIPRAPFSADRILWPLFSQEKFETLPHGVVVVDDEDLCHPVTSFLAWSSRKNQGRYPDF